MKTLLVLRHAKSSWKEDGLADHERAAQQARARDAPRIGEYLRDEDLLPDVIVSSTAHRAKTTADLLAATVNFSGDLVTHSSLYLAGVSDLLAALAQQDDRHRSQMVVAHNPGLEELVEHLTGQQVELVTAALAVIELPLASWSELDRNTSGQLSRFVIPKDLPERLE